MKKTTLSPGTIMAPLPAALVSCGTNDNSNIITIAWTGIVNSKPPMTYISVRPERFSYDIIREKKEFVINLPSENLAKRADICGMKSGRKIDKFKHCGFTKSPAEKLADCPIINECPINIECKVVQELELGSHTMFLAEIVAIRVNSDLLDDKGRLLLHKAKLIGYSHGEYLGLGRQLGKFGFSVAKKK